MCTHACQWFSTDTVAGEKNKKICCRGSYVEWVYKQESRNILSGWHTYSWCCCPSSTGFLYAHHHIFMIIIILSHLFIHTHIHWNNDTICVNRRCSKHFGVGMAMTLGEIISLIGLPMHPIFICLIDAAIMR